MPILRFAYETTGEHFAIRCYSDDRRISEPLVEWHHAHVICGDQVLSRGEGITVGMAVREAVDSVIAELTALHGAFAAREETVAQSLALREEVQE